MTTSPAAQDESAVARAAQASLLETLLHRRSSRFASGRRLNGGPLAYASIRPTQPLTLEEEAVLAFAACGITGDALADLPYASGDLREAGSGNIIAQLIGRTAPSPDAAHSVAMFVLNDDGTWLLKRPQDYDRSELSGLIQTARQRELVSLYERARVPVADHRLDLPREIPYVPAFNKWSANVPGTTYYLPVSELSALYINVLLTAFNEEFGYFVADERNGFRPAGVGRFARSRGGHLNDDPQSGRFVTIGFIETLVDQVAAIEQGAIVQNLGLMAQALGLGGFTHFASHPFGWFQALGFRMTDVPLSRVSGTGLLLRTLMRVLHKDLPVPTGIGFERAGQVLLQPYCPPYYGSMRDAVLGLVDFKYGPGRGIFRDGGLASAWRDGAAIQAGIPDPSERAIAATIAYCEYVYQRYGRFPSSNGPFRTTVAYQAHNLDPEFYARFYREDAR